jgi:four helix bundle protein
MAKQVEELTIWQLAVELRRMVMALSDRPSFRRDGNLCHQVRDAASSIASNIAEGYARYQPGEFARFVRYARGSAAEVQVRLEDAFERGHISEEEYQAAEKICRHIAAATTKLLRYLCDRRVRRSEQFKR